MATPEEFARRIIEGLKDGTAPWAKPWKPARYLAQHNPVSGTVYRGANRIMLSFSPYDDPRWVTFKQARDNGWHVKRGEKGTPIVFFTTTRVKVERDEKGRPVKDEDGESRKRVFLLDRPVFSSATVFNAAQVEGMPPLEVPEGAGWDPCGRAEDIARNCGVPIFEDQVDRAYYSSMEDEVHVPPRASFGTAEGFYSTLLHEIGHSTGHPSRFDRETLNFFGSEEYAREELRAEIASWMAGLDLGIGHDPGSHVSYVGSWVRRLEEKPAEIFKAAREAQRICDVVLSMEHGPADWETIRRNLGIGKEEAETPAPAM